MDNAPIFFTDSLWSCTASIWPIDVILAKTNCVWLVSFSLGLWLCTFCIFFPVWLHFEPSVTNTKPFNPLFLAGHAASLPPSFADSHSFRRTPPFFLPAPLTHPPASLPKCSVSVASESCLFIQTRSIFPPLSVSLYPTLVAFSLSSSSSFYPAYGDSLWWGKGGGWGVVLRKSGGNMLDGETF